MRSSGLCRSRARGSVEVRRRERRLWTLRIERTSKMRHRRLYKRAGHIQCIITVSGRC
jgi:hypothetical protein